MASTVGELLDRAADQRRCGRNDEALVSAITATELDKENANAWWQAGLIRLELGEVRQAIPALERTVELVSNFAGGWARLGSARLNIGDRVGALNAFKTAFQADANIVEALRGIVQILDTNGQSDLTDSDLLLAALTRLDEISETSSHDLNSIGILHYNNKNFFSAVKYWRRASACSNDPASLFNLGLAYNHPDVAQIVDAIDVWRLAMARYPDNKRVADTLAQVLPQALNQAQAARSLKGKYLLSNDQWFTHYLNPFELLNCPPNIELQDLSAKTLRRFKDILFKEIELEDGVVSWLSGAQIDRSKAISICDDLNNEIKRDYHWRVFRNRPLLDFMSRGGFDHFLADQQESKVYTLEQLIREHAQFLEWLSEPFAKQYDLIFSTAINLRNSVLITSLLGGRRLVAASFAERCFQNSTRQVDGLLQPLREAAERANQTKQSAASIKELLEKNLITFLMNVLPVYFREFQQSCVKLIREIAQLSYSTHSDIDLANAILELTRDFKRLPPDGQQCIDKDFEQITTILKDERDGEAMLTAGSTKWQITRQGALLGSQTIPVDKAVALRLGVYVERQSSGANTYDFLLAIKDIDGVELRYAWKTSKEIENNNMHFSQLRNAAMRFLFPKIVERTETLLKNGRTVRIGTCDLTDSHVSLESKGWFFVNRQNVPWHGLSVKVANGDLTVFDSKSFWVKTTMDLRNTENAMVLQYLAEVRSKSKE